jgi:phage virion morphogenesis protein
MRISIDVDDQEVKRSLARLSNKLDDMTPIMRSIGQSLDTHVQLGFRSGQDPYGNPWAPLSQTTLARRRNGSNRPLRDTARLQNSFSTQAGKQSVEYGTNVVYAKTHQYGARKGAYGSTKRGAPIPWGNIPARPMLPSNKLPEALKREILSIVKRGLS